MTRKFGFTLILLAITLGARSITLAQSQASTEENKKQSSAELSHAAPPPAQPDGDYVGSEVCVTCHAEQHKTFVHTIMGNAMAHPKTPLDARGCEACHGPGKAHVDAGGGKETIPIRFTKDSPSPVEEQNSACLSCHTKGNQMFWRGSPHESRAMACVDCHQVHYGSPAERYAALASGSRYGEPLTEHAGTKNRNPSCVSSAIRCGGRSCSAPLTCRTGKAKLPVPVGIRSAVLRASVDTSKREAWYARQIKQGVQVVISHPKLVETGLDLLDFPTILFYESGYSLHSLRQASRRSWSIGQRRPVRVKFLCYEGTMQTACSRLMGKKLLVALTMEGKFAGEGLQNIDEDDDMLSAMARELVERNGIGETADAVWKALNTEHQKLFPASSHSAGDVTLVEVPTAFEDAQPDVASLVEKAIDRGSVLIFGRRPGSLSGRRSRAKPTIPGQATLFG